MKEEVYHADPCGQPSFSASIGKILWSQTPLHAWHCHPKLNPAFVPQNEKKFDLGRVCHAMLLEKDNSKIAVCDFADWRKKEAQAKRDAAYEAGLTPLLPHQYEEAMLIVEATKRAIAGSEVAGLLDDGNAEVSLFAVDQGIHLRSRLDWLTSDRRIVADLKITSSSVHPDRFARFACGMNYDLAAAMYVDMVYRSCGGTSGVKFIWIAQEDHPPYACCLIGAAPSLLEIGEQKYRHAKNIWRQCISTGSWPGYPSQVCWAEAPQWEQDAVLRKTITEMEGDEI